MKTNPNPIAILSSAKLPGQDRKCAPIEKTSNPSTFFEIERLNSGYVLKVGFTRLAFTTHDELEKYVSDTVKAHLGLMVEKKQKTLNINLIPA